MATYESKRYAFSGAALSSIDATSIADGTVLDAEFQYINTLASNAQTQLTARLPLAGGTMTGAAHFNDNVKASFGNTTGTPDMEIYHDTSNSYIKNSTGYLKFLEDNYEFNNNADSATFLSISSSGLTGVGTGLTALNATNLGSGTVPDARFPATLPATSGVNLTALNASNLGSGTAPTARLGSGTASSSTFLRGDGAWSSVGSLGKILQVISTNSTTTQSSTTTAWTDITNLTVDITPAATANKVLIFVSLGILDDASGSNGTYGFRIMRDTTPVGIGSGGAQADSTFGAGPQTNTYTSPSTHFLDSPSSTSAITYKVQFRGIYNPNIRINTSQDEGASQGNHASSSITVIEVAG